MLRAQGLLDRMEVAGSYLEVLRKATSAAPGSDSRGPRRSSVSHI
jgi:hypothetical protein